MSSASNSPHASNNGSPAPAGQFGAAQLFNNSSASTSASSPRPRINTPRSLKSRGGGSRNARSPPAFTASMQDAQARNKNPYMSDDSSDEELSGSRFDAYWNDSYENTQKRRMAAVILDSPELLMMHSQARCDSIPGTRHYFTKMLCGYHDEKDTYPDNGKLATKEKDKTWDASKRRNATPTHAR